MKTVHHIGCEIGLDENLHTNGWKMKWMKVPIFFFIPFSPSFSPSFEVVFLDFFI
jgi:hypothetical protein